VTRPAGAEDTAAEEEKEPDAGRLSAAGREAAVTACLPLVATYFADAPTWDLEISGRLDSGTASDAELDDLAAAVRLRGSLAAADRLLAILDRVVARPTFRYTQVAAESVGSIRGRLDLGRYTQERGRVSVPRRYPVRLVARENATPENVLAAYATTWLRRDLDATPSGMLKAGSPETRALRRLDGALGRALGLPLLAGTRGIADEIWRRGTLPDLLEGVDRRLEGGHVAGPEPYADLYAWMTAATEGGPVADAGDRPWAFYDERFDTKLFEIWALQLLAVAITTKVGPPRGGIPSLARRGQWPLYIWSLGAGELRLHFQPALNALAKGGVRWSYDPGPGQMLGFPDLAVTSSTPAGDGLALFDPKLRRRTSAPTDELYKLLGYFANLRHDKPPVGAILYYSPEAPTDYQLVDGDGGRIHALGLDPETSTAVDLGVAAELALRSAGLDETALQILGRPRPTDPAAAEEHTASMVQAMAAHALGVAAKALPAGTLDPVRKVTEANLRSVWALLSDDVRTMVVSAEYFGVAAPADADLSGPLLGLAAAIERILHERIIGPAALLHPQDIDPHETLGGCLHAIQDALRKPRDPAGRAVADAFRQDQTLHRQRLQALLPDARTMNRRFRIPAAHAEVVDHNVYLDGREFILGVPNGLLPRLARALNVAAGSSPARPVPTPPTRRP
jgi:hypothetical protein